MLKSNNKKVIKNIKEFVKDCASDQPISSYNNAVQYLREAFEIEASYNGRNYKAFENWTRGLPCNISYWYYYDGRASQLVAKILEENEQERAKYSEEQAAEQLTEWLYNAVVLGKYKEPKTYQEKREELRQEAQEWQNAGAPISWLELAQKQEYFYNNAKKYGLIKEFKNEGIL